MINERTTNSPYDRQQIDPHYESQLPLRSHKDTVFRMLFSEKEKAIELYNALEGTDYGPDTDLEFTTLENAIYADRKNDLGFIIDQRYVVITEHQSTKSYNLPLRDLFYISRTYENIVKQDSLYGEQAIKLPTPEFYVVYTGSKIWEEETLRLSDYFKEKSPANSLDLVVKVVKIGYTGDIKKVLEKSPTLFGYSMLLTYIKEAQRAGSDLKTSIDKAVKQCLEEGYLTDFLRKHGGEVTGMLFKEITSEEFAEIRAKEAAELAYDAGEKAGYTNGKADGEKAGITMMKTVLSLHAKGLTATEIIKKTGYEPELIQEILE